MSYHRLMLENQMIYTKLFFDRMLTPDLSHGQPKVLEYLLDHEGCMQKDIAVACMIEPPSVTSLLSKMEKDQLITRESIDGNRRSLHIYLTKTGKQKAIQVKEAFQKMDEAVLSALDDEEKKHLLDLLSKINRQLHQF